MRQYVLVCAASARERDYWMMLAKDDGAELDGPRRRAVFPKLELEFRFEVFERREDAERIRGLNFAGVVNFGAVRNAECRSMILARLRP